MVKTTNILSPQLLDCFYSNTIFSALCLVFRNGLPSASRYFLHCRRIVTYFYLFIFRFSLAKSHVFCNISSLPILSAKCQAVFRSLYEDNNNLYSISYIITLFYVQSHKFWTRCCLPKNAAHCQAVFPLRSVINNILYHLLLDRLFQIPYFMENVLFTPLCFQMPGGISDNICG
jgi:hypothetical protein